MIETHPFGSFVSENSRLLILGSFPSNYKGGKDWFYTSQRNQFWPILESVYDVRLKTRKDKKILFRKLKFAITDVILKCERDKNKSSDINLKNLTFNINVVERILRENEIEKIYFTSRFVERIFYKEFKNLILEFPKVKLITLPSPSPRYAAMKLSEKVRVYKKHFPKIS